MLLENHGALADANSALGFPQQHESLRFCCALGVQELLTGCGASSVSLAGLAPEKVGWEQGLHV